MNSTNDNTNILERFKEITTFIFDMDGVLTDGTVLVLNEGLQARQMHVKDGLGMQMALSNGYKIIILSGGYSEPVIGRLNKLGITEVHLDVKNKLEFVENYIKQHKLQWNEILFMGDDLPDVEILQKAGMACCPADAIVEVKKICNYISPIKGGYGCVRDVIEKVLKVNDHWNFHHSITSK